MTEAIVETAPGKLMMCGEYAVLEGAPAILTPVQRKVAAQALPTTGHGTVQIVGPAALVARFDVDGEQLRWQRDDQDEPDALRLVRCLYRALPFQMPITLRIDSRALFDQEGKLGLGSSAAVAAAVGRLFARLGGHAEPLSAIIAAHRAWQHGSGSGADVACAVLEQTVVFDGNGVAPLPWPEDLHVVPVRVKTAAATVSHIARWEAWLDEADDAESQVGALAATAADVLSGWQQGDAIAIISGLEQYTTQMIDIDHASGIGYFAAGHADIAARALAAGVSYKPCGAGGGDFGIAFSADPVALAAADLAPGVPMPGLLNAGRSAA